MTANLKITDDLASRYQSSKRGSISGDSMSP